MWRDLLIAVVAPILVNAVLKLFEVLLDEWLNKYRRRRNKSSKRHKRKRR